jgi:hypothetical protein
MFGIGSRAARSPADGRRARARCRDLSDHQFVMRRNGATSQRNLAGLLVHGGEGIGLVWFLDGLDATHNASPEENARGGGSRLKWMWLTGRGLLPLFAAPSAQRDSLVLAASRVLPAADWSATRRRFHGYRGHAPDTSSAALSRPTGCRGPLTPFLALFQPRLRAPVRSWGVRHGCPAVLIFQE